MPGYKPYRLEKLRKYILMDLGREHFVEGEMDENRASLNFAKILFLCGEY